MGLLMDSEFYAYLSAMGELGRRKRKIRSRIYLGCAALVFPVSFAVWSLVVRLPPSPTLLFVALGTAAPVCFAIAESQSRKRIPAIATELAKETGLDPQQLMADSRNVDSAG